MENENVFHGTILDIKQNRYDGNRYYYVVPEFVSTTCSWAINAPLTERDNSIQLVEHLSIEEALVHKDYSVREIAKLLQSSDY
jgi:hypothetical protein